MTFSLRTAPVSLAALALVLGGCAVGPDYARPAPTPAVSGPWIADVSVAGVGGLWWRKLNDPVLTDLVDAAIAGNMDIQEAGARLREVRANRDAVEGRGRPQAALSAGATENRLSANGALPVANIPGFDAEFPIHDIGFDASWEIDLWGATRRAVESADARAAAAEEARRGVILQITAEVVRAYVDLRAAQSLRRSAFDDATAQLEIAGIVEQRHQAGIASRFDVTRARAQARTTAAAIPGFEADATAAVYRLALLTGQPPEALMARLREFRPLPAANLEVSVGLRSDLLLRRPDIRQAERDLAAATADVGVATADLFPRISLLGGVGQQARDTGDLFSSDSLRFQVGPSLRWPIFSGGRIRAQIRAADARADAAAIRYERAVLTALSDSETAINRFASSTRTRSQRDGARDEAGDAVRLARQRYLAGEDDLTVLLQAESAYSLAERGSIQARTAELQQLAALYKALGGGWEAAETASGQP
ncbi:efflux transporter outer membrane subunit [Brevundimonas lenta]|uniref:NodT family efflux transporter outer membrane factor (OMF) lipoprotein n=1 Tax=Brevundimonas lenta TaxID=424796 RepID=A0A7W6NPE6_9CAUL|nr:efflux transporter outer membrane subunit [Brevundimonas lenta]MBB4082070.1 NodT family efflux transporter outer membrane factor (OMF) lipoprotein [Brevundimonas lenta]